MPARRRVPTSRLRLLTARIHAVCRRITLGGGALRVLVSTDECLEEFKVAADQVSGFLLSVGSRRVDREPFVSRIGLVTSIQV